MSIAWFLCLMCLASCGLVSGTPLDGAFNVTQHIYPSVEGMDSTDKSMYVFIPNGSANQTFPLVAFAHGFAALDSVVLQYEKLLTSLASFGFIIVAPAACKWFCKDDSRSLPWDPPGYGNYYTNQLKAIEWARHNASNGDPLLQSLDLNLGAGIVGHSMGGQATLFSSSYSNATQHNVRAAVLIHPFTHSFPAPTVPFLVFTGDADRLAPSDKMAKPVFDSTNRQTRGFVNKKGATHDEPDHHAYNPLLPQFVASFLKLYVANISREFGLDYHEMIFGNGTSSMCGGGDGSLEQCETYEV